MSIFESTKLICLGSLVAGFPGSMTGLSGGRGPPDRLLALAKIVLSCQFWNVRQVSDEILAGFTFSKG